MSEAIVLFPDPEWPTIATDWLGSIVRLKLRRTDFLRDGYRNHRFLNSIRPSVIFSTPDCLGSIFDGSSIIPNTSLADARAAESDGSEERATPVPIAPTKIT